MVKKNIAVIVTTFTLIAVVFCGCIEQSSDKEIEGTLIGTWIRDSESNDKKGVETWIFYENKTVKIVLNKDEMVLTKYFDWDDNNSQLCLIPKPPYDPIYKKCGSYEFSNGNTSFIWTLELETMTFHKA